MLGTPGAAVAKPGTAVAQSAAGKQTIVIASPRPAGATPAKIMTAVPKGVGGTPGAQYIVMTTRPGTPGSTAAAVPGTSAPGRVISTYYAYCALFLVVFGITLSASTVASPQNYLIWYCRNYYHC